MTQSGNHHYARAYPSPSKDFLVIFEDSACCLEVIQSCTCRQYGVCRLFCSNIIQSLRWQRLHQSDQSSDKEANLLARGFYRASPLAELSRYIFGTVSMINIALKCCACSFLGCDRQTVTVSYSQSVCRNLKTSKRKIQK